MPPATPDPWPDDQLAQTTADIFAELPGVEFKDVAEAARQCRSCVPRSAGLPALKHQMRRRALGFADRDFPFSPGPGDFNLPAIS